MSLRGKNQKFPSEHSLTENILTVRELATYLRLTEATVCNLASSGELPGFKIGKSWRFDRDEVLDRIAKAKSNETSNASGRKKVSIGTSKK